MNNTIPIENLQIISILSETKNYQEIKTILSINDDGKKNNFENINLKKFKNLLYFAEINLENFFSFYNKFNSNKKTNSVYKIISNWKKIKKFYRKILNTLSEEKIFYKEGYLKRNFVCY